MKMRIGINLGPVKLIKDINSQPNIIGDGINVAQRVMSFSEPGQILVSRSYYEVVSRLSEGYAQLFHFEGSRTDKHVREHEVYAVQSTGTALKRPAAKDARSRSSTQSRPVVLDKLTRSASFVTGNLRSKPRLGTALAVVAILVVAVGLRANLQPPAAPVAAPSPPPPKIAAAPTPAPAKQAPKAAIEIPSDAPPRERATAKPAKKPVSAPAITAKPPPSKEAVARTESTPSASGRAGIILLTIRPWGEIYIDGKHVGTVPPLHEFPISPGKHHIEIQNPDFPSYVRTVDVKPGARISVNHWFQAKEQPNPLKRLWK
jgi:hypothetical protein